jgi:adenylate kinase
MQVILSPQMASKHRFATEEIERFSTVDLISELKRRYQVLSRPERSCVLLGPDYAGVETQATFLRKEWGMCTIKRTDILKQSRSLDAAIKELSDEIGSFRCRRGFAVSHFPETTEEAKAFDDMIASKHSRHSDYKVFIIDLPSVDDTARRTSSDILSKRARGMLLHPQSGRIYNTTEPELAPQTTNLDDVTGESLVCPNWNLSDLQERVNDWWDVRLPQVRSFFGSRCRFVDAARARDTVSVEISKTLLADPVINSNLSETTAAE